MIVRYRYLRASLLPVGRLEPQADKVEAITGIKIKKATTDAGYAYAAVYDVSSSAVLTH
jgi:hypothetical protein